MDVVHHICGSLEDAPRRWDLNDSGPGIVEKLVEANVGVLAVYQQGLMSFMASRDAGKQLEVGKASYVRFLEMAPTSHDFSRLSNARLYYMADKVRYYSLQIYRTQAEAFEDLLALGFRHVVLTSRQTSWVHSSHPV